MSWDTEQSRQNYQQIVHFTQNFKHFLYEKRFKLRTDHKTIVFMPNTNKAITPQF